MTGDDYARAQQVLAQVEHEVIRWFDAEPARASVSFVGVETMQVLRFAEDDGGAHYVSMGMCRAPMTAAEAEHADPDAPRAELVVRAAAGWDRVWAKLAILAAAPAVEGVVYRPGMTVDVGEPLAEGAGVTGAVVTEPLREPIVTDAGPVLLLGLSPATPTELAWCRIHGAAELQQRWAAAGTELGDLRRASVALD